MKVATRKYSQGLAGRGALFIRDTDGSSYHYGESELAKRFRDAMIIFRARVELLASLDHQTTEDEAQSLKVMLEALLEGKKRLGGQLGRSV